MTDTFKVGKKYQYTANEHVYECLWADNSHALLSGTSPLPSVWPHWYCKKHFKEHKEPKTIVRYVNVYPLDQVSGFHLDRVSADYQSGKSRVACKRVEITYTEGEMDP